MASDFRSARIARISGCTRLTRPRPSRARSRSTFGRAAKTRRRRRLELEQLESRRMLSGVPTLVRDLSPWESNPTGLGALGPTLYFGAVGNSDSVWKSDGTEEGTVLVKLLRQSEPRDFTAVGSTLFFTAYDSASGRELWKTDGTEAGTVRVADIVPGASGSAPSSLTAVGSTLYFTAFDFVSGYELWKTDGTQTGTVRVKDIGPGQFSSNPQFLTAVGSTLYFSADGFGETDRELWKTDGTEAGTVVVKDIYPEPEGPDGTFSSSPSNLTAIGSTLYFSANDGVYGNELWKTDGTEAGTVRVKDIRPDHGSYARYLTAIGSTLYFTARNGTSGEELWRSDGTEAGTVMVKDIWAGSAGYSPRSLTAVGSTLYFAANDGTSGFELWKTDGTAAGTVRVSDIRAGDLGSHPSNLTAIGSTLYFTANDGASGREIWKTDGTEAGTVRVKDIRQGGDGPAGQDGAGPRYLTAVGSKLFFTADDGVSGRQLWMLDHAAPVNAAPAGAPMTVTMREDTAYAFDVPDFGFTDLSDMPANAFAAVRITTLPTAGMLWNKGEVVPSGAFVQAADIAAGNLIYTPITNATGAATFTFQVQDDGGTLDGGIDLDPVPRTMTLDVKPVNGVPTNTPTLVKDINPAGSLLSTAGSIGWLTTIGSTLYFSASDGTSGYELWKTDGTSAGTVRVKDIRAGDLGSNPGGLTAVGSTLYFAADDGTSGQQLWKTDGTEAGTVRVSRFDFSGYYGTYFNSLTAVGSTLFFTADDGTSGRELWKTDVTETGTVRVKDIRAGSNGSNPRNLTVVGSTLYFTADDGTSGYELWKTDGTEAGTVRVKDIRAGDLGSNPGWLTPVGCERPPQPPLTARIASRVDPVQPSLKEASRGTASGRAEVHRVASPPRPACEVGPHGGPVLRA